VINLGRTYNVDQYAIFWSGLVKSFLTDEQKNSWIETGGKRLFFKRRLYKYRFMLSQSLEKCDVNKTERRRIIAFFVEKLKDIDAYICSDEVQLKTIKSTYFEDENTKFSTNAVDALKEVLVKVYEEVSKEHAYELFKKLDVRTCPYCNRQYTFVIEKDTQSDYMVRPEMEHFYDKSDYPLLALCFYNLVPSCHECNHGKGTKSISINPYFRGFETKFVIAPDTEDEYDVNQEMTSVQIGQIKDTDGFKVGFKNTTDDERDNIKKLGLTKLYNEHRDYVMEMIEKASTYNEWLSSSLVDSFQGVEHSPASVYDFVWGKYLDEVEQYKRPLSKLTKDVLEQLNIKR